jgi:septum formation topological specificity factor MinE
MLDLIVALVPLALPQPQDEGGGGDRSDVPVTIKEIDVAGAIREFQEFQRRLGEFRQEIGEGRTIAQETAQILDELRQTAAPENDYNEEAILQAVTGYVDGVIQKQVQLVDFLESQRYRITYYANKMAASVRPEDLAVLFGTEAQSDAAIAVRVRELEASRQELADFVDSLPAEELDKDTFRPTPDMPRDTRRKLDVLLYRYQQERSALDLAKKRLQVVRAAERSRAGQSDVGADINADLLVGQMFGTLDRIRLQMSMDLVFLEQLLSGYARSSRTQEILEAFQNLIELQGDLEGPSPELASILDWLQDSSTRRINLGAASLARPGLSVPRYSDLLREAYLGARGGQQ